MTNGFSLPFPDTGRHMDAWVPGHWLAMLPVIGIGVGYLYAQWGFTFAYICLWIAFTHFVIRGITGQSA